MISQCRSIPYTKLKTHKNNGWGVGGGEGDQERSPTGGETRSRSTGVANLDRSPDQPPGGEAYIP